MGPRTQTQVSVTSALSQLSHLIILRQDFSLNLEFANSVKLAGLQAPGTFLSPFPSSGITVTYHSTQLLCGCWASSSLSTLLIKPLPQPQMLCLGKQLRWRQGLFMRGPVGSSPESPAGTRLLEGARLVPRDDLSAFLSSS